MSASHQALLDSMHALFYPKTVAVIGASRTRGKHGNTPIRFLQNCGFPGEIFPINPSGGEVEGLTCYASVGDVPRRIDCALMVIPAAGAVQSVRECAAAGVRNLVMGVTGFSEMANDEGRAREEEVRALARASGMRIVGPNTNGIFNASAKLPLGYNTSHGDALTPGPVSIAAHSGALFNSIAPRLRALGAGLSKYIAVGTEADLNVLDFFDYYIDDNDTGVIALILEAINDGARFRDLAARARAAGKPVVALKLGRSAAGAGATIAHSTRLAGSARAYDALFEECGVAVVPSVEALAGGCAVLLGQRLRDGGPAPRKDSPRSRALVCIATTGGGASLLADYAETHRMPLAGEGDGAWGGKVAELVAGYDNAAVVRNPLDSSALGGHDRMTPFFLAMEQDGFDGPVVTYTHMLPNPKMSELVAGHMVARRQRTGSPVVIVVPGGLSPELETIYRNNGIPLFHDMATCFDSLACHYQTLDAGTQPAASTAASPAMDRIASLLANAGSSRVLSEWDSAEILRAAGLPVVESRKVATLAAAHDAARALGYPVVLKALAPGVAHKNRAGLVAAGIRDEVTLHRAWDGMMTAIASQGFASSSVPMIVQPMLPSQAELIVGVSWEPPLGHFLVAGLGGIYTEALNESRLFPVPVSEAAMRRGLGSTRLGRLLAAMDEGRDSARITDGVLDALAALQRLVLAHGDRIESIDVNPLLAGRDGCVAVDALVVLKPAS